MEKYEEQLLQYFNETMYNDVILALQQSTIVYGTLILMNLFI